MFSGFASLSKRWQITLDAKKREVEKLQRELIGCIGCGCLSMKSCRVLNPDDTLAETGAGPVRVTG